MGRHRWWALSVLCLGVFMIVLDATIVNVALPSIRADLNFSSVSLVWVVNAYLLTFGGFLLLGGRLGDLLGQRRVFLMGIALFTVASALCGFANSRDLLIGARALQGVGAAIVTAVALSLLTNSFADPTERAKAMGIYSFVCSGGGTFGLLLGGILTSHFNWHWIFLVNLPFGVCVYLLCLRLVPPTPRCIPRRRLDIVGAFTITAAAVLTIYGVTNTNEVGWASGLTLLPVALGVSLTLFFLRLESHASSPLLPLHLFRLSSLRWANIICVLWSFAIYAWFFISALYLQLALGYTPQQVGFAFVPANAITAIFALGLSARLVLRFGIKATLVAGALIAASGFLLFAYLSAETTAPDCLLPAMALVGVGSGLILNPMLLGAMRGVPSNETGIASGIINTASMLGGAFGLAILVALAGAHGQGILAHGANLNTVLNYHLAFLMSAGCACCAAAVGAARLQDGPAVDLV
jgi:EmrB/QacA subfamily drug resistance transporter